MNFVNNSNFSQTHKSFIVNLKHILTFDNNDLKMSNGDMVPISRHYKDDLLNKYLSELDRL